MFVHVAESCVKLFSLHVVCVHDNNEFKLLQYISPSQIENRQSRHQIAQTLGSQCIALQSQIHFPSSLQCVHPAHFQHSSRDLEREAGSG